MIKKILKELKKKKNDQERPELLNEILELHNKYNAQIDKAIMKIQELEQHKLYYISLPGSSDKDLEMLKMAFNDAKKKIGWTIPNILFLNREVSVLTEKELKSLLKIKKQLKKK